VGQTATAQQRKGGAGTRPEKTDEATYLQAIEASRGSDEARVAKRLIEWAKGEGLSLGFNKYPESASFLPTLRTGAGPRYPISVNTKGSSWVQMRWLRDKAPFNEEAKRQELLQKLNAIPGVNVPPERMTGYPHILLSTLTNEAALQALLGTLTWLVKELRAGAP
jgi:hypothetical protein